jgi:uncharacterized protein YbcV (DUF1398 family)
METNLEDATKEMIEQCARNSHAGIISFGEVVATLTQAGVESYHADYRQRTTTYYLPDGATHSVQLHAPDGSIPAAFDASALQAAIRGAQRVDVKYPRFLSLSMAAGCVGYIVWRAGRHVSYFGHRGETHIEPFPSGK